jgi:putative glycerol-1-phosphate dehydrogenase
VGDLVSNLSAKKDCEIAERNIGETIDAFALELASLGAESVLKFKVGDINTDLFINRLAYGLIFSGMAMIMSGNSRPASGAEHLISHAIDEYYPDRSTLHGVQVAWAQLMLEKYVRKDQQAYHQLYNFFKELGLYEMFSECLFFSEDDFRKLLPLAREMRKRYTVLNTIDL